MDNNNMKSMVPGFLLGCGVAAALAVGAVAIKDNKGDEKTPIVAESKSSGSSKHVSVARREPVCRDVQVTTTVQGRDNRTAGTLIGGALGGLAGSQIGEGKGNQAATAAGAVAGAMIGRNQGKPSTTTQTHIERRCS